MAKVYRRSQGEGPLRPLKSQARYLAFSQGSGYIATDFQLRYRPLVSFSPPPLIITDTSNPTSAQDTP